MSNPFQAKFIFESLGFERGKDPKESMDIGLKSKYGKMYDIFMDCHSLANISENFSWVSDITINDVPLFTIESLFYYTDEEDNRYPETFIIMLYPDSIFIKKIVAGNVEDEWETRKVKRFIELTTCFEEVPDEFKDK